MSYFNIGDFTHKQAFVIALQEGQGLESFESIDDDIASAQEGLEFIGFDKDDDSLKLYDDADFMVDFDEEYRVLKKWSLSHPNEKALVYLFYKGHSIVHSSLIKTWGPEGQDEKIEGFLRDSATLKNVYAVGVFDCCRRNQGNAGIVTNLIETKNLVCIYREPIKPYVHKLCDTCETSVPENMAAEFFGHLFDMHNKRKSKQVQFRIQEDYLSFKSEV